MSKIAPNGKQKHSVEKYTIPKPFQITDEIKKGQSRNKDGDKTSEEVNALREQFKAKPVDKQMLEPKPQLILGKT